MADFLHRYLYVNLMVLSVNDIFTNTKIKVFFPFLTLITCTVIITDEYKNLVQRDICIVGKI